MPTASRPKVSFRFDGTNTSAQKIAKRQAARLVTRVSTETKQAIRAVIVRSIREGIPPYDAARTIRGLVGMTAPQAQAAMNYRSDLINRGLTLERVNGLVDRYAEEKIAERAWMIARTETLDALNEGVVESYRQAQKDGFLSSQATKEVVVTPDELLCPICEELDGQEVGIDESFDTESGDLAPPFHPQCLPGDALVSSVGRVAAESERWYEGDLLVVRTASGHELACTPNHPILTNRGWIAARSLDVGDNVVSLVRRDWEAVIDDKHENVPARIQDVARSLKDLSQTRTAAVPVSAEDFHGDGLGSEIAVIGTDGPLWDNRNPALLQQGAQVAFAAGHCPDFLTGDRQGEKALSRHFPSTRCLVCGASLSTPLGLSHSPPLEGFALALAARLDPAAQEFAADDSTSAADCPRDRILGFAGKVQLDPVIELGGRNFAGHVFNLQTASRLYVGNGIVVHNCRCAIIVNP